jgi:dTDP-4-amino-4,6-dideoxygalactose transaminase
LVIVIDTISLEPIPFLSLAPQHTTIHNLAVGALVKGFEKNWYILGEALSKFESEYARFNKVGYCIGVGNGYDALSIALRACNVGRGDEVIVPAHTYVATWLAIGNTGAKIVPVEADPNTLLIDVRKIEDRITKKTKAIVPVHLYGQACNMTVLEEIARRHPLAIVEDNAQGHGAMWNGQMTGSFGLANATSFYPTKNLGALGDGGAITTNDTRIADYVRQYRNYGFERKNYCAMEGVNSRLDELQASVLTIKLTYLNDWNDQRRRIAAKYIDRLKGIDDIRLPVEAKEAHHVYHLFVIRSFKRDKLKEYLQSFQIETMIHYPVPPHMQKPYASLGIKPSDLSVTEEIANTALSLPLWPGMRDEQVEFVCDKIAAFYS